MKLQNGKLLESFSGSQDISTISSSHYSNRKMAGHCSMVRFKEECPPHRIDCPLGRKPGRSTRAEEKPLRDTPCWLRGKVLDMPCDSYWDWLSWFTRRLGHFVSFKNRNYWPLFKSCLKSSSDCGTICIKFGFGQKWEVFIMKKIYAKPSFPCDYAINAYCRRVITLTGESKPPFFFC